jgi:hypothetical protein
VPECFLEASGRGPAARVERDRGAPCGAEALSRLRYVSTPGASSSMASAARANAFPGLRHAGCGNLTGRTARS